MYQTISYYIIKYNIFGIIAISIFTNYYKDILYMAKIKYHLLLRRKIFNNHHVTYNLRKSLE